MEETLLLSKGFKPNFTQVPNTIIMDSSISARAKGVYLYLCSYGDNAKITRADIVKNFKEGRNAISAALNELCETGYLICKQQHDESGKFSPTLFILQDKPKNPENPPLTEKPLAVKPHAEKPLAGNGATVTPYISLRANVSLDKVNSSITITEANKIDTTEELLQQQLLTTEVNSITTTEANTKDTEEYYPTKSPKNLKKAGNLPEKPKKPRKLNDLQSFAEKCLWLFEPAMNKIQIGVWYRRNCRDLSEILKYCGSEYEAIAVIDTGLAYLSKAGFKGLTYGAILRRIQFYSDLWHKALETKQKREMGANLSGFKKFTGIGDDYGKRF